jgi:hypothetical protein
MKKQLRLSAILIATLLLAACTPEIGSPEWCEMIEKKDKGDITTNQGKDYIKYCLLKQTKED